MATLLLTAVGSAVAGPIGAAIGAMAGQQLDRMVLGPKARQGARLADLSVQSSTYGARIPRIYGRMRVSGTVVWATDLREERRKVSQGKGRPKTAIYSYSASFAVLLSARRAGRIGRIWADGKLLRGDAGDFKIETGFRFYDGDADQPVDPLIAASEGAASPAYRGRAYAVFEDMALESFGNRIPVLSFEVIADEAPIAAGEIFSDLGAKDVVGEGGCLLEGFVADGGSIAGAIEPLNALWRPIWTDTGDIVHATSSQGSPISIVRHDLGAGPGLEAQPGVQARTVATSSALSRAELIYADLQRDFQSGVQALDLHQDGDATRLDVPASLTPASAAELVRAHLLALRRERDVLEVNLPWRCLSLWSASLLDVLGELWCIRSIRFQAMCLIVTLVHPAMSLSGRAAVDSGRAVREADLEIGTTTLALADLPSLQDGAATAPIVVAAAAGTGSGWRSASLMLRAQGNLAWEEIGGTAAPAVLGSAEGILPPASAHLVDLDSRLRLRLLHDGMTLSSIDDGGLWAGGNLALLGGELIQFGTATRIGSAHWELSRLLRGRRGTEQMVGLHADAEQFLLLDADTLLALPVAAGGAGIEVLAKGVGDREDVIATLPSTGVALCPLPPVHLCAKFRQDGALLLRWVRQSREGWLWRDGVDAPLGEETELYRVNVSATGGASELTATSTTSEYSVASADIAALRVAGAVSVRVSVCQIGRLAVSRPAILELFI